MKSAILTKAKSVLVYKTYVDGHAMYTSDDDGTSDSYRNLIIDGVTWNDLDRPNEVTLTVEPGDRLN